jgi:integrase
VSLKKRGRIWHCKWIIGGKEIAETTGTSDRQAAQEYHDRRRAELWRADKLGDTRIITWDEAALSWVEDHAQHKRSYETDRQRLEWITGKLTGRPANEITTDILLDLRKKRIKGGNSPATANRYLAVASAVLNYAHDRALLPGVPNIPYLPEDSKDIFLWITRGKATALIKELPPHLAAMTRLALATGLRRANITGLTWDNVDTERRVTWVWGGSAKGKKHFTVPLNDDALAVIKEQRDTPKTWDKDQTRLKDPRYVFTFRGKPIFHVTTKAWTEACKRAGIDPAFTFHDLRHTWASWHVMAGTPLPVLQQLGAWSSMDMVMRYAHLAPGYVANYASNVLMESQGTKSGTIPKEVSNHSHGKLALVG